MLDGAKELPAGLDSAVGAEESFRVLAQLKKRRCSSRIWAMPWAVLDALGPGCCGLSWGEVMLRAVGKVM